MTLARCAIQLDVPTLITLSGKPRRASGPQLDEDDLRLPVLLLFATRRKNLQRADQPGSWRSSLRIVSPIGLRMTISAMSSRGVSWLLMITRLAPACLASRGNEAAGSTTRDDPMEM